GRVRLVREGVKRGKRACPECDAGFAALELRQRSDAGQAGFLRGLMAGFDEPGRRISNATASRGHASHTRQQPPLAKASISAANYLHIQPNLPRSYGDKSSCS